MKIKMVDIPGHDFQMLNTEVTQKFYNFIMGENPSHFKGENNPVENVSWYDAIYFCNELSEMFGFIPVYEVDGETDVTTWDYIPHIDDEIIGNVTMNEYADGFRLPTVEEWKYAAIGGRNYTYAGSNDLDEVGWYRYNSGKRTHPVARKKANRYGLYDMSGNVWEWCWDVDLDLDYSNDRYFCGGSWDNYDDDCEVGSGIGCNANGRSGLIGFRLVRTIK